MTEPSQSPLHKLIKGKEEVDQELLASLLESRVRLYLDPPQVELAPEGNKRNVRDRVLLYLLGRKALQVYLKETGHDVDYDEKATPSTISIETRITGGSVRPALAGLKEKHLVRESDGYFIPNYALEEIAKLLADEEK